MKRLHFGVIGVVGQSTQCTSLHLQAEQLARGRRSALKERSRVRQCQDFLFFFWKKEKPHSTHIEPNHPQGGWPMWVECGLGRCGSEMEMRKTALNPRRPPTRTQPASACVALDFDSNRACLYSSSLDRKAFLSPHRAAGLGSPRNVPTRLGCLENRRFTSPRPYRSIQPLFVLL